AAPLALLATTEKVVVEVMLAVASVELFPFPAAGAAHVKFVAAPPSRHTAVKLTSPPPAGRLFLSALTEQFEETPTVVVVPASQLSVKLPFPPVTENDAHDELLNVNDAA